MTKFDLQCSNKCSFLRLHHHFACMMNGAPAVKSCDICHNIPLWLKNEPRHEISNNVVCGTSKGSDQPSHMCSLIRTFASRLNIL